MKVAGEGCFALHSSRPKLERCQGLEDGSERIERDAEEPEPDAGIAGADAAIGFDTVEAATARLQQARTKEKWAPLLHLYRLHFE